MNKWVYSKYGIHLHQLVIDMEQFGYNGLVVQTPDHITEIGNWAIDMMIALKNHCANHNIEIIPMMCAVGKLNHWMKVNKPEFIEMMPAGAEYSWDGNHYELMTETPNWSRPASIVQTDGKQQMAGCMANNELINWYVKQLNFVCEHIECDKILLSLDEIRAGGTCERCKDKYPDELLSNFVNCLIENSEYKFEPYAWGDMFDPTHNAKYPYYHLPNSTEGALELMLKSHPDFKIVSWNGDAIYFRTNAISHMRSINIDQDEIKQFSGDAYFIGYMYTTWKDDYSKLKQFADIYFKG